MSRHYRIASEKPIQERIFEAIEDLPKFNSLIDDIKDGTLPELEGNVITAALCFTIKGDVENAKKLINKIDLSSLTDHDHYDSVWTIANNRGNLGNQDPSLLVIKHMIEVGFRVGAIATNKINGTKTDVLDQIVKQSGFGEKHHSTDLAIIAALLETGSIAGFPKDSLICAQTLEGLRDNSIEMSSLRDRPALSPNTSVAPATEVGAAPVAVRRHSPSCCNIL